MADLKSIYGAATEEENFVHLMEFQGTWGGKVPIWGKSWEDNWDMRCAFSQAVKWEYIAKNLFLNATLPKHKERQRQALPPDQLPCREVTARMGKK